MKLSEREAAHLQLCINSKLYQYPIMCCLPRCRLFHWLSLWLFCQFLLSAACASVSHLSLGDQPQLERRAQLNRLAHLTFPLAVAATASCPFERELTYGFVLESGTTLPSHEVGGSIMPIVVQFVHPDLSAGGAGLLPGDQLLAINETPTTGITVDEAQRTVSRISRARIQPLTLVVARGHDRRELNLWGTAACRFTVHLVEDSTVNALADGDRIYLTTGMLKFVGSDDELAWVLAHELAHNVLGHPQQTRLRGLLNSMLAATTGEAGEKVSRPELEMQADKLASYLLVQAGYDLHYASMFLHRLALAESSVGQKSFGETHPATAARIEVFERVVGEIGEKVQQGALQRANMRQEQDASLTDAAPP